MDTTQSSLDFLVLNKHTVSRRTPGRRKNELCALLEEEGLLFETVKHRGGSVPNRGSFGTLGHGCLPMTWRAINFKNVSRKNVGESARDLKQINRNHND